MNRNVARHISHTEQTEYMFLPVPTDVLIRLGHVAKQLMGKPYSVSQIEMMVKQIHPGLRLECRHSAIYIHVSLSATQAVANMRRYYTELDIRSDFRFPLIIGDAIRLLPASELSQILDVIELLGDEKIEMYSKFVSYDPIYVLSRSTVH